MKIIKFNSNIQQPQDKGILLKDILESGLPYQEKAYTLTASYDGAVFWNSIQKKQRSMIAEPIKAKYFTITKEYEKRINDIDISFNEYLKDCKKQTITEISEYCNEPKTKIEHYFRVDKSRAIPSKKTYYKLKEFLQLDSRFDNLIEEVETLTATFEQNLRIYDINYKAPTLTSSKVEILAPLRIGQIGKGGQGDRIYSVQGKSVCLSANGGGRGAKTGLYKIDLPDGDYHIRKLTPNECARLQGFPDKKKIIDFKISSIKINQINNLIEKWQNYVDLQKKNAPAETKNHKLQKYVEIASTKNLTDNVISAEQILNTSHQNLKKLVVKNVLINCEELTLETPNLGRLKLLVNNALIENLYRHQTIIESFVAEIVGIILTQGKEIKDGEGEICQNIQNSFFQLNGKNYAERYGQDIAELVKDVERSLTERNIGHFIATISEAGKNFRAYEWSCLTLFCYVIVAIVMSTQEKIQIESLLEISIKSSYHQGISNSQAYKCYGNSFTVPVIEHIIKQLVG